MFSILHRATARAMLRSSQQQSWRAFSKKNEASAGDADEAPAEEEPKAKKPKKTKQAAAKTNTTFQGANVVQIETIEGHKPPVRDDSIEGRYASVLFSTASKNNSLYKVYADLEWLAALVNESKDFENMTKNAGLSPKDFAPINNELKRVGDLQDLTHRFLEVLVNNERLPDLPHIVEKYIKLYNVMNKEEKVTIISAEELSREEKKQVQDALGQGFKGTQFTTDFQIDTSILGGLQMYTESKFMDLSLKSRIDRIQSEIHKMTR